MSKVKPQYEPREADYRRSELMAPFCPTCNTELDGLSLANDYDSCKCGTWSRNFAGVLQFKPYEAGHA